MFNTKKNNKMQNEKERKNCKYLKTSAVQKRKNNNKMQNEQVRKNFSYFKTSAVRT